MGDGRRGSAGGRCSVNAAAVSAKRALPGIDLRLTGDGSPYLVDEVTLVPPGGADGADETDETISISMAISMAMVTNALMNFIRRFAGTLTLQGVYGDVYEDGYVYVYDGDADTDFDSDSDVN